MTPEQEEQVARALAETARHEPVPPLPDEVAARLDGVLAELVAARAAAPGTDPAPSGASVTDLGTRRRRRRPNVLVAAAAVALIVAAGGAVATGGFGIGGIGSSSSDSASSTAGGSGVQDESAPEAARGDSDSSTSAARAAVPRLRTSTLAQDVHRLVRDDLTGDGARTGSRRKALSGPPLADGVCLTPSAGPGELLLAVRLDGRPATLLLGPVTDGARSAEVFRCDSRPVASLRVPLD